MREQAEMLLSQVQQAELSLAADNSNRRASSGAPRGPSPEMIRRMHSRVRNLRVQSDDLLREAASVVLQNVQVVACTCAGKVSTCSSICTN